MKGLVAVLAATLLSCSSFAAVAQMADGSEREALAAPETQSREEKLEALFLALASAPSTEEAKRIERDILEIWLQSGSDTVDLLMEWTLEAMEAEDYPRALDFLDRIVTLEPRYAEGWNKRATVHFMNDDLPKSIADLEMVLAIEPRHFGALAGLGAILDELEEDELALSAFRRALELDPFMEDVQEAIDDIEKESGGHDI
jgi:tetratricopeptide (TPR) repeat protein